MYTAAVFLPLLGSIIAGLFGRQIGDRGAQVVTSALLGVSALLSVAIFLAVAVDGHGTTITLLQWMESGSLDIKWALRFDSLTAVMMIVVTWVSFMVHVYSIGYMSHDHSIPRFMSYLSLFTFAMLMLVTADNLVQLFFGWEGVGVASYLLIGFWYEKPSACAAAIKAFVVNRVGDFGFALGIFGTFLVFDSVSFDTIFRAAPQHANDMVHWFGTDWHAMTIVCLLLFVGAMGKSAQLGLHTWLPDAMEGPTPVSALIHAATMVTAGVFMVARMSPLFELSDTALGVVTVVGAFTAFFAATVGLVQNDIKRIIAYSTCSQLGYMFFALGVSAYQAGIFHLFTHAFFKALLFLGAGSVIHALSDEQDIRKMGGVFKHIPLTGGLMYVGSLALVFHGKPRADEHVMAHVHESPLVMTLPLAVLALGAVFAGMSFSDMFVGHEQAHFWNGAIATLHPTLENAHHVPSWVPLLPTVMGISGIVLAYVLYLFMPSVPKMLAETFSGAYQFLLNKWCFDELYDFLFVKPAFAFGKAFWKGGDGALIDGVGPDGVASASRVIAAQMSRLHSGYVYHYAFAMIVGVAAFVTWYMIKMG